MSTRVTRPIVLLVASGALLVACGDDGGPPSGAADPAPAARAAQRLETYLDRATKDLVGSVTKNPGQVVSDVQPANGKLKIYTLLNSDIDADDVQARAVCRAVRASHIPEAKGALVVDGGDVPLRRC